MNLLQNLSLDTKIALKISLTYAVVAIIWILFSDQLLLALVREPQRLTFLQSVKGWFFVAFTSLLLFFILQNEIRKQIIAENLLRKNSERLKETQRLAQLGSWEFDIGHNKLWWSDETYRIFGFKVNDETAFEKFIQTIHPEDSQNLRESIMWSIRQGKPLKLDYRIILPNGDIRYLHEESRPLYDEPNRDVAKRVGSVQDITDQKELALERETLIKKLEKSLEEIKTLRGILPLCSFCKKVRDDNGYWQQVDVYIHKHSAADISHSVCPDCLKTHYSDFAD